MINQKRYNYNIRMVSVLSLRSSMKNKLRKWEIPNEILVTKCALWGDREEAELDDCSC